MLTYHLHNVEQSTATAPKLGSKCVHIPFAAEACVAAANVASAYVAGYSAGHAAVCVAASAACADAALHAGRAWKAAAEAAAAAQGGSRLAETERELDSPTAVQICFE